MGIQDFGTMDPNASLKQVIGELANLMDTLNFLLNGNLDVKNIRANSVTADRIKANTITAREILANSITADKLSVTELSAISANLGKVIAGILIGAYVSTADGTYPRIDFSSVGNLLTAFFDSTNHLDIIPDLLGVPALRFTKASVPVGSLSSGGSFSLGGSGIEIDVISNLDVNLVSTTANVVASSIGGFIADIPTAINSKANSFSGYTGSFVAGTKTVNVSNGIITSVV